MPFKQVDNSVTIELVKSRNACWGEGRSGNRNPASFFDDDSRTKLSDRYFVGFASKNDHRKHLFVRMLTERGIIFKDNGADVHILASRITEEKIKEFLGLLGYRFGVNGSSSVGVRHTPDLSDESGDDLSDLPRLSAL